MKNFQVFEYTKTLLFNIRVEVRENVVNSVKSLFMCILRASCLVMKNIPSKKLQKRVKISRKRKVFATLKRGNEAELSSTKNSALDIVINYDLLVSHKHNYLLIMSSGNY